MEPQVDDRKRLHKALDFGQKQFREVGGPKKRSTFSKGIPHVVSFLIFCFLISVLFVCGLALFVRVFLFFTYHCGFFG